jgi:hypothetical protein
LVDLSGATKLKHVVFQLDSWNVQWVITALQTTIPKHRDLRQITIDVPYNLARKTFETSFRQANSFEENFKWAVGEANCEQWLDFDHLLVQLWESRSIHTKGECVVMCFMKDYVLCLLPEATKKGIINLAEHQYGTQWI